MIRHLAVVVPAADEEDRIAGCLDALRAAAARGARHVRIDVTVVLDACTDRTAAVLATYPEVRSVPSSARCVGAARMAGTAAALAAAPVASEEVWTAHTDADSEVPRDWLAHMIAAAESGFDVVLGTVTPSLELPARLRSEWELHHDRADGHRHVHGANLGIRAATLRSIGGWRPLPTGEDVDLVHRAASSGARILRAGAIPVRTSARCEGRAPLGFSSYLRGLAG